jgi:hypothetical protein
LPASLKVPRGFGLRQPSAAFPPQHWRHKSGRGLPQSKTLARQPANPSQLVGYSFIETVQSSEMSRLTPAATQIKKQGILADALLVKLQMNYGKL